MALIECNECKAQISSMALSCPKCGNPISGDVSSMPAQLPVPKKSHGFLFYLGWLFVLAIVLFVGSAILAGVLEAQKARDIANDPNAIHADDVITLSDAAYGCQYENKFAEALRHYDAKELTAWAQIINDEPYCFYSHTVKSGQKWTVLQVKDNVMQVTTEGISDTKRYGHNYWTLTTWGIKN